MRLEGKSATAGSGFGAGIAGRFMPEGGLALCADINPTGAQTATDAINAGQSGAARAFQADAGISEDAAAMVAVAAFGDLDILAGNLGGAHCNFLGLEASEAEFGRICAVNAKSIRHGAMASACRGRGGGVILNIAIGDGDGPARRLDGRGGRHDALDGGWAGAGPHLRLRDQPGDWRDRDAERFHGRRRHAWAPGAVHSRHSDGAQSRPADIAAAVYPRSGEAEFVIAVRIEVAGGRCV